MLTEQWEINARYVEKVYGVYANYDEGFYICSECGEPVYSVDWEEADLYDCFCPICEFCGED